MRRVFAVAVALTASALSIACASILGIEDTVAPTDSGPTVDAFKGSDAADASDAPVKDAATDTSTIDASCAGACTAFTSGPCVLACNQTASDITTGPNNTALWINTGGSGGVISADESTGAQQPLISGTISPGARIASAGTLVFYTDGALLRVLKNNAPIDMTTATSPITSIAVAGTRLGYTFGPNVSSCSAVYAPCSPTPIGTNLSGNAGGIVGDSNQDLYWFTTAVQLWWCTKSSCPNNFVSNLDAVLGVSWNANANTLYALGNATNAFIVTPWVLPNTKGNGLIGQGSAKAITADGDHLYVASTNGVQRSIGGGSFSQMVAGSPSAIAADNTWVVWVDQDKIMRAPR